MNQILINKNVSVPVTPGMIGLFFEDINYNLDGGLHAEMLENRNFEALRVTGYWDDYRTEQDGLYAWTPVGDAAISLETESPQNEVNPHYLRLTAKAAGAGVSNKAYDGIYVDASDKYELTFYARSYAPGKIMIRIADCAFAELSIEGNGQWKQYHATITAGRTVEKGAFKLLLKEPGTVDLDLVSLMPKDAVRGIFRKDLVQKLKDLKPGFLRFPGGCIIEGNNLANRYQWKKTVGPVETRKYNWNRWAIHGVANVPEKIGDPFESPYSHYGQTYGVGYYEYFLLSEELGAKPLPVLSVGLACQYQSTELVPIDTPEFQEFIQDALDLIEFANGDVNTAWGRVRAEMGHPEPFNMDLIGIGNEQWQTEKADFFERYELFEKAIHEKYPEMRLIGSAGPDVKTPRYEQAWNWLHTRVDERIAKRSALQKAGKDVPDFVYAVDEHYYVRPAWLYENVHFYDEYPRTAKVFAGEYAAHVEGKGGRFNSPQSNNFEAALAEAAFLTGVERNADVVVMASYAPLIARLDYAQWSPDLIWFSGAGSYGTPSYYVQQMYSLYMGDRSIQVAVDGMDLYASATFDSQTGRYMVKVVNSDAAPQTVRLALDDLKGRTVEAKRIAMACDDLQAVNSIANPENIAPVQSSVSIEDGVVELAAQSFNIFVI